MATKNKFPKFAICINNKDYPASLELHKIYRIIPDEEAEAEDDVRVIDESGEDYLFPAEYFLLLALPAALTKQLTTSFARLTQQAA
ncbi:MAG TPA: hypothetical protein VI451_19895 [Anaerolineales bacterium]|nr:hypothetical protein [Anaerolineales bacterium]